MTHAETLEKVIELIRTEVDPGLDVGEIRPDYKLRDQIKLNSLDLVTLSVAIEDEFELMFDPIEMDLVAIFDTVGSLATFIYTYRSQQSFST